MPVAEFWNVWNDEENTVLKALVWTRYGGMNDEFLSWYEIAKIMNINDDLEWSNNGRTYNDVILRFHWQDMTRKAAEKAAQEAQKGEDKEKNKEKEKDKEGGERAASEA